METCSPGPADDRAGAARHRAVHLENGDTVYGGDSHLRGWLVEREISYALAVGADKTLTL